MPTEAKEQMSDVKADVKAEARTEKLQPAWVAIIYRSAKEAVSMNDEFDDRPVPLTRAPLWRSIGLKPRINAQTGSLESKSLDLNPGANLGIPLWQYEEISQNRVIQGMFDDGIFEVVFPIAGKAQDLTYVRYSAFSDKEAIALIKGTTHESWLEQWSKDEARPEIIKAVNTQLELIKKRKAQNKAS